MKLHKLMNMILSQKISSNEFSTRLMELQQRTDDSRYDGNLCGKLTFVDWLNLISNINTQLFMLFGYNYKTLGLEASQFTFFYEPVKYYLTLQKYVAAGYSYEKIKSIFLIMFNNNVSLDDFNKCFDREYLDRKICLEPLQNYWNSQDFLEIVHSVIKE